MPVDRVSKDEAFTPLPDEASIRIQPVPHHQFQFTRRWFRRRNQATWSTFLAPKFRFHGDPKKQKPIRMLQIGVFEAMDLVWCCQNVLQHPNSRAMAVDPWLPTSKQTREEMQSVYERARHNLEPYAGKVTLIRGKSQELDQLIGPKRSFLVNGVEMSVDSFDLVVVDGDHRSDAVLKDAHLAASLVKVGGWIVFDDVRQRRPKVDEVPEGIDKWADTYPDEFERFKRVWAHRFCDCYERVA